MMNRRGEEGGGGTKLSMDYVIYTVLLILSTFVMLLFIRSYLYGAVIYEDFYAKEIANLIDSGKPGDEIVLDIKTATEIAQKNGVNSFSDVFTFDNVKNEICVQLNAGRKNCVSYFNDVDVIEQRTGSALPDNLLRFSIVSPLRSGGAG